MTSTTATTSATLRHPAPTHMAGPRSTWPGFWRAPFARATYREFRYTVTSLPLAIAGFVFAVAMFSVGVSTLVVWVGLPVLVAMLAGARGLAAVERRRADALLGVRVEAPVRPEKPAAGMVRRLADAAGWKALLFHFLMFPWRVATFCFSVTFLVTGWVVALFPTYSWVFHRYLDWPGYRLYDFTTDAGVHHAYYVESPAQIAGVSAIGFLLVFLTPVLVHALTNVDRGAVRALLGRRTDA
ncbi:MULTISPECIES: sensor domain-containing protein [unclassified Streptomyces]|uniref:sensor domain-containing protein n=1 Tax=unclassified Streptomyces TaxID=2593676 RepID=UPI00278BBBCF|nr:MULTISPECIES: sensor domain-containing protein [unclassified Streptomyces]